MTSMIATTTNELKAAVKGAFAGSMLTIYAIVAICLFVLLVIAYWKMFTKAGEKGWKSIIPFYDQYVLCKLTWAPRFFWIRLILGICGAILLGICNYMVNIDNVTIATVILFFISVAALITYEVLEIIGLYRISTAYGHGGGYTVGLVLIPNIMLLVLGFGSSKYEGNIYQKNLSK